MQKLLSVMLVDDEIMALNHLKKLIDWESDGFRIVASETNPQKAFEIYQKLKPRIIFVDVQMPIMNGLDLSRDIINLGFPVKIVILTSYKDFQYAKKSIEIGVSGYLVKHELNNDNLLKELNKLKNELSEEEEKEKIVRQRLLRLIVFGNSPPEFKDKRIINKSLSYEVGALLFLFCRVDTPFPVIESAVGRDTSENVNLRKIVEQSNLETFIDVISLNPGEVVLVKYLDSHEPFEISENTIINIISEINRQVEKLNLTVSVCSLIRTNNIVDFLNLYSTAENVFKHNVFSGRNKIYDLEELNLEVNQGSVEWMEGPLRQIEKSLFQLDSGGLRTELSNLFNKISEPPWNLILLKHVCNKLEELLDKMLKNHNLMSFPKNREGEKLMVRAKQLFSIEEISVWFEDLFSYSIKMVKDEQKTQYSKLVLHALDFIHKNYQEDWAIEDIADKLDISEVYLRKKFKTETGFTVLNYLTEIRMKEAKFLLESEDYKIFEIAKMVGYNTSQYFSKVFRKHTGVSPADYVKMLED